MAFYRVSLTNLRPEPPYHLSRNIKIRIYPGKQPRSNHLRQQKFSTKILFNTTSFLYEQTSILSMIQPPLYIYNLYIYNTYSAIHIIPCTAKPFSRKGPPWKDCSSAALNSARKTAHLRNGKTSSSYSKHC